MTLNPKISLDKNRAKASLRFSLIASAILYFGMPFISAVFNLFKYFWEILCWWASYVWGIPQWIIILFFVVCFVSHYFLSPKNHMPRFIWD